MTEAGFIEATDPMVWRLARRLAGDREALVQDLFQEGRIGVLKHYRRHKGNIRCKISTFAYPAARGPMLTYLMEKAVTVNAPHTAWMRGEEPPTSLSINGMDFPVTVSMELEIEARIYVDELSASLTPRQRQVVRLLSRGHSIDDCARQLRTDRGSLYKLAQRVRTRLIALEEAS
jgi:RNA polymerase sigma factor (sigma-70 family)